jgi:hypothetical protein
MMQARRSDDVLRRVKVLRGPTTSNSKAKLSSIVVGCAFGPFGLIFELGVVESY